MKGEEGLGKTTNGIHCFFARIPIWLIDPPRWDLPNHYPVKFPKSWFWPNPLWLSSPSPLQHGLFTSGSFYQSSRGWRRSVRIISSRSCWCQQLWLRRDIWRVRRPTWRDIGRIQWRDIRCFYDRCRYVPRQYLILTEGRDFDFFGKTAKIADVMEEEQMTYARSHSTQKPPTQVARQAGLHQQQQQQQQDYVRQLQRQSAPPPRAV